MTNKIALIVAAATILLCGGCEHGRANRLPSGAAAYATIPIKSSDPEAEEVIRIGDRLAIRVLGEPELTSDLYRVEGTGYIQVPLAGEMIAAGLRPVELREELTRRLAARYLRDPQVAVIVVERRKTSFSVEGEVREPGVFEASAQTTLLAAIAQAKSPTNVAKLNEVMVFRLLNGERMGARFDLKEIRNGNAADPQVLAGDTIVVGRSSLKGAWLEFLEAAPAFNLFYIFR